MADVLDLVSEYAEAFLEYTCRDTGIRVAVVLHQRCADPRVSFVIDFEGATGQSSERTCRFIDLPRNPLFPPSFSKDRSHGLKTFRPPREPHVHGPSDAVLLPLLVHLLRLDRLVLFSLFAVRIGGRGSILASGSCSFLFLFSLCLGLESFEIATENTQKLLIDPVNLFEVVVDLLGLGVREVEEKADHDGDEPANWRW